MSPSVHRWQQGGSRGRRVKGTRAGGVCSGGQLGPALWTQASQAGSSGASGTGQDSGLPSRTFRWGLNWAFDSPASSPSPSQARTVLPALSAAAPPAAPSPRSGPELLTSCRGQRLAVSHLRRSEIFSPSPPGTVLSTGSTHPCFLLGSPERSVTTSCGGASAFFGLNKQRVQERGVWSRATGSGQMAPGIAQVWAPGGGSEGGVRP